MNTDSTNKDELLDDFESIASDAGIDRNALLTAVRLVACEIALIKECSQEYTDDAVLCLSR